MRRIIAGAHSARRWSCLPLVVCALLSLTSCGTDITPAISAEQQSHYQKMAEEARWEPLEKGNDFRSCLAHELKDYQVEVICRKSDFPRWEVTIRIVDDGKEVYAWNGHLSTVFFARDGILYYADFDPHRTGCAVVAYDLKGRKQLWKTQLKGIGPVAHSKYFNAVRLDRVNDEVLAVYGKESYGRYIEIVDLKTGKTVGHKVFPEKE